MSLHLGNLSSHTRRDDLERIFQGFGRCAVQVKDKFGFVIYEYPGNAEKALRTLKGKKICGERITVSWSNRQPRPLQRNTGGRRPYENTRGRNYAREMYSDRKLGLYVRDDDRKGLRQVDSSARLDSSDGINEATGHQLNNMKDYVADQHYDSVHDLPDEDGGIAANFLENGRWLEQDMENGVEHELDFDRYEPYLDDGEKEQEEIHTSSYLDGASHIRKSEEKPQLKQVDQHTMERLDESKSNRSCYACGEVGHKMHRCPQRLKRLSSTRPKGPFDRDRDAASTRRRKHDREASTSRNHGSLTGQGDSSVERIANRIEGNVYQENKRSMREDTVSRSQSQSRPWLRSESRSQRSHSGSHSHSRSELLACRKSSTTSKSRSGSTLSRPGSNDLKSLSVSRSSSHASLSLSVSLGQPLPSSSKKVQMNKKEYLVDISNRESSMEVDPLIKADAGEDNSKLEIEKLGVENESSAVPIEGDEIVANNHTQSGHDVDNHSLGDAICELKVPCSPKLDNGNHSAGNISQNSMRQTNGVKTDDFAREDNSLTVKTLETEALARSEAANLMTMSSKEICILLKTYGLKSPNEDNYDLPPESYLGCARFWPWEIVYYRRLKKGPISKDNYARRLAQNEEFGIFDKYVRSSSGWAEEAEQSDEKPRSCSY